MINLAPEIQEAILNSTEPDGLILMKLRGNIPDGVGGGGKFRIEHILTFCDVVTIQNRILVKNNINIIV